MAAYIKIGTLNGKKRGVKTYIGAAADTKPASGVAVGSRCYEYDTTKWYVTHDSGTTWTETTTLGSTDVTVSGVSTADNDGVSVGATTTQVLAVNTARTFAALVNDSDEIIYLSLSGTAIANKGIRLNVGGGSYEINMTNLYTGAVFAICASGSKNMTVAEG